MCRVDRDLKVLSRIFDCSSTFVVVEAGSLRLRAYQCKLDLLAVVWDEISQWRRSPAELE